MADKNPYVETIKGWNWTGIRQACIDNAEKNYEGEYEGREFLGTVFALYPSGKYYMPWACSNVELCPKCNGAGHTPNKRFDPRAFKGLDDADSLLRTYAVETFGPWCEGKWPKSYQSVLRKLQHARERASENHHCEECNGMGSAEAYQDELFGEALELVANEHGLWITSGEGDPCDIMAGIILEESDIEEMEVSNG